MMVNPDMDDFTKTPNRRENTLKNFQKTQKATYRKPKEY